ncbi:MAG: Na(+)/H(+) antiporter subunit D [Deltaproteobacteria bacterium]|nr:Na(+)/H(+) antiporter subunit D [Deltaproteobacteria bacterium]
MTNAVSSIPPALVFIVGGLLLPILPKRAQPVAFLLLPVLALALLLQSEPGTRLTVPFLDYELVVSQVDRLGLAFGYVFTIIAFLGGVYGFSVMGSGELVAASLYAGSALGVVFAGDLFTLFIFWETMAVSSVCLIWARRSDQSYRAGMRYLLVHLFGGSVLLAGILWHLRETGSIFFTALEGGPAAYLILFGFALNAAVVPLHTWLSDSYPEATVTGGVFLSAFTTKAAVCVLARAFSGWEILVWAGVVMAIYGVVFAVLENDIRRLLAYHIISQVGYMVAGVGIGTETAINGVTAHAFAHILYKGLLFMGAGAVLHAVGRSKLTELGGLARHMPFTVFLYMVGAFSISGVPLFSGFVSKSMVVYAAEMDYRGWVVLLLHLASIGTFLHTGLKLPYFTWFGGQRSARPGRVPTSMHVGMILAALVNIGIGVYPAILYDLLPYAAYYQPYTLTHLTETMQLLSLTALGFWLLVDKLSGEPTISLDVDWLYRKPARLMYRIAVSDVNRIFASGEALALNVARLMARASVNPAGYFMMLLRPVDGHAQKGRGDTSKPETYDPDRSRLAIGLVVIVVLLCFVILVAANFVSSLFP